MSANRRRFLQQRNVSRSNRKPQQQPDVKQATQEFTAKVMNYSLPALFALALLSFVWTWLIVRG